MLTLLVPDSAEVYWVGRTSIVGRSLEVMTRPVRYNAASLYFCKIRSITGQDGPDGK